jgi:signal transduction histidine kinase
MYVLTVAALLVPAGGIAYLGVVSYREERGAIAAQDRRQSEVAAGVAARIDRAITDGLDEVDRAVAIGPVTSSAVHLDSPVAAHWFWIDGTQRLRVPRPIDPRDDADRGSLEKGAPCAAGAQLEECVRELSTREQRVGKLRAAQRAEACRGDGCATQLAEAKRQYVALVAFDDTGPAALLGLARINARVGDGKALQQTLGDLERRFADRSLEGISVGLVVAMLRSTAPGALLDVADDVLANKYVLSTYDRVGVLSRIRARLGDELPPAEATRRATLEQRIEEIKSDARAAAGLADDQAEIQRTATTGWIGRTASREPGRTLIYRRRADGGIIGMSVDARILEQAAGAPPSSFAVGARALVLPVGGSPAPGWRRLGDQVSIAEGLPQLSLAIVNPTSAPDPRDAVIAERSQRHVIYTSVLAVALAAGLLLLIRNAVRQRELAQLKSDFVSTVSHELKTPLTSIRMFAEMLEQGVAKGDPAKMARYHGVIVQESQRLGLLIANLLDYAQIEKGTRRYAPSRNRVAALSQLAVTTFETLRDPEGQRNIIEVTVSPEAEPAEVEVDRDVVVQAVLNLLANATKYGGTDSPIEVALTADATSAAISVRDHGPGIPASEQPRIFREFYRSPEAYRSGVEGTGLGLALVKRHIEALGGTVEVASIVGEGATFTIRFPRAVAETA